MADIAQRQPRQIDLGISILPLPPRIGMVACLVCSRPISVGFYLTKEVACRQCTAVHRFTWLGTDRMPRFEAIVEVPGDIPKEYLDQLNLPGLSDYSQETAEDPQ